MAIAIKMDRVPIEHETLLWQNPDPTTTFTAQTIPVTQSVTNFRKIRIYWYNHTNLAVGPTYMDIDMSQYDLFTNDSAKMRFVLGYNNNNDTPYIRLGSFNGDAVYFGTTKQWNSTTTSNATVIPYKVTGISRREIIVPSRGNERIDVLWTNPTPNSAMESGTDVTLAHGAEKYDILRVYHKPNASALPEVGRWIDFYIGKEPANFTVNSYCSRMTLGDLVGTTTYTRAVYFREALVPTSTDSDLYTTLTFGNGSRIANTTTNTSNVIPLIVCGVNFVEGSQERIHNNFTISATGWSSSTVVFGGENCYYNDIIITQYDDRTPVISIMADDLLISKNEQLAYKAWKYATVNTETMKLRLYSPTVPANDFTIHVEGVM